MYGRWQKRLLFRTKSRSASPGLGGRRGLATKGSGKLAAVRIFCILLATLPWWLRWERVCLQCGRPWLDPWVQKIPWIRKWQPMPVFLPRESHGWRSLEGYSPLGGKESDMTELLYSFYKTFYIQFLNILKTFKYITFMQLVRLHFTECKLYSIKVILETDPDTQQAQNHLQTLKQDSEAMVWGMLIERHLCPWMSVEPQESEVLAGARVMKQGFDSPHTTLEKSCSFFSPRYTYL